jgi:ankyrin repeat protein
MRRRSGVACCSLEPQHPRPSTRARAPHQVDAADGSGQTALHRASQPDEYGAAAQALVLLLLQRGARVDARDADGETPLHVAARHGCFETMRLLLDRGAEVDAPSRDKITPLMALVCFFGHSRDDLDEGVAVLAGRGADVNAVDADGRTPLWWAVEAGFNNHGSIRALLAAGARAKQDGGPGLIDKLLDAAHPDCPPEAGTLEVLLDAGAGASLATVGRLAEVAAPFIRSEHSYEAEALFGALPRVLAVAQRALDEDEGARVAARLAAALEAAVDADRRDVASGLRTLITGAAAEARRLEAARVAAALERRAAEAERAELLRLRAEVAALGGGGAAIAAEGAGAGEAGPRAKRARGG